MTKKISELTTREEAEHLKHCYTWVLFTRHPRRMPYSSEYKVDPNYGDTKCPIDEFK